MQLEDDKKRLIDENEKLKRELRVKKSSKQQKRDEDAIIHYFSDIYSKLLDVAISNIED